MSQVLRHTVPTLRSGIFLAEKRITGIPQLYAILLGTSPTQYI